MTSTEVLHTEHSWIAKTPGRCGGRACIRDTRIPVWSLVTARRLGVSDADLLHHFVTPLKAADIEAAWAYFERYPEEIETDIHDNETACATMARLYADENFQYAAVVQLRRPGHDVLTVQEAGQQGLSFLS